MLEPLESRCLLSAAITPAADPRLAADAGRLRRGARAEYRAREEVRALDG